MKASIQVGIRLRPFLDNETNKGYINSKIRVEKQEGKVHFQDTHTNSDRVFEFDHIFEQSCTQRQIYSDCKVSEMVGRVLDGFHSTIFAYGQTGSGKTYTMEGRHENSHYVSDDMKGIVILAFDDLFTMIAKQKVVTNKSYNVSCSFLQIYNEKIFDLLNHDSQFNKNVDQISQNNNLTSQGLKLRWNAREQFSVENLFLFDIKTSKEAMSYFFEGVKNRVTASHKLNMTSSRSHTIFTVTVNTYSQQGAHETTSKLQLVDLAGSERTALTGTEGRMAKESIDINKSLFTLRQVITALSELNQSSNGANISSTTQNEQTTQTRQLKVNHIPYRESKLTSLLKQSIGGNSYCLMIACIVPNDSFSDENISTLQYASRATYIRNQPVKNQDPNQQILFEINQSNINLKSELEKVNAHIAFLTAALQKSEINNVMFKQNNDNYKQQNYVLIQQNVMLTEQNSMLNQQNSILKQQNGQQQNQPDFCEQEFKSSRSDGKEQMEAVGQYKSSAQAQTQIQIEGSEMTKLERLEKTRIEGCEQTKKEFDGQKDKSKLKHQKQFEEQMKVRQNQDTRGQNTQFNQLDGSTWTNRLVSNLETSSNSIKSIEQQPNGGVYFLRHDIADTPVDSSQNKYIISQNMMNQTQSETNNKSQDVETEYDNFSDRLIESITLVRQLLESNKQLRQQTDEYKRKVNISELELADITTENQQLRDQLNIYLSKHGDKLAENILSSPNTCKNNNLFNRKFDIRRGDENDQQCGSEEINSQNYPSITSQAGESEKPSILNFKNIRHQKKSKNDNNFIDDEEYSDIKELVNEENLDTQQAEMSTSNIKMKDNQTLVATQIDKAISIHRNDGNNYHSQTKNQLISEILELRHNLKLFKRKIKSLEMEHSQLESQQRKVTIQNSNIIGPSIISTNSDSKNQNTNQSQIFYTIAKKRGVSQHQSPQKWQNNNQQNSRIQFQDDQIPSKIMHTTPLTTTSIGTVNIVTNLNHTSQNFNIGGQPSQNPSKTISNSTITDANNNNNNNHYNKGVYPVNPSFQTNIQSSDQIPTNFCRFKQNQHNLQNIEKHPQQQKRLNYDEKYFTSARKTLSNIRNQQFQEQQNDYSFQFNDNNGESLRREPQQVIPSVKQKRSNSLAKNQINVIVTTPDYKSRSNQAFDFYLNPHSQTQQTYQGSNLNTGITYTKLKKTTANSNNSSTININNEQNVRR